ncbi:MAG: DUF3343 domain-containing protein [Clostridia bacterium]|nr:DUF3343 domain-containing protein [Clostridia bacterium]
MRKKTPHSLITFRSTEDAMAAERILQAAGIAGRLVPIPASISAGCGLCFIAPPEEGTRMEELLRRAGVRPQQNLLWDMV